MWKNPWFWVITGLVLIAAIAAILYFKKKADIEKQKADELANLAAQNTAPQGSTNIWAIIAGLLPGILSNFPTPPTPTPTP